MGASRATFAQGYDVADRAVIYRCQFLIGHHSAIFYAVEKTEGVDREFNLSDSSIQFEYFIKNVSMSNHGTPSSQMSFHHRRLHR